MNKILLSLFIFVSCSDKIQRTNIVHAYIFTHGERACKNNDGLHYIVSDTEVQLSDGFPCNPKIIFSCQDGTKIGFDTGVRYCFIGEDQLKETLSSKVDKWIQL